MNQNQAAPKHRADKRPAPQTKYVLLSTAIFDNGNGDLDVALHLTVPGREDPVDEFFFTVSRGRADVFGDQLVDRAGINTEAVAS